MWCRYALYRDGLPTACRVPVPSDKAGTSVAVPSICWKVLLRTRSGRTGKRVDQITDASQLLPSGSGTKNASSSIKRVDGLSHESSRHRKRKTGYKFFTMRRLWTLPRDVKAQEQSLGLGYKINLNYMKKLLFTPAFRSADRRLLRPEPYKVVFYNFETLFDTIRNPEIYDEEYTPEGPRSWNTPKYSHKRSNNLSARVVRHRRHQQGLPGGDTVFSEIEKLANVIGGRESLRPNSPAPITRIVPLRFARCRGCGRGVLLTVPRTCSSSRAAPRSRFTMETCRISARATVCDDVGDDRREPVLFHGGHWPSRLGGQGWLRHPKRERAAEIMRHAAVLGAGDFNPATKVVMDG